MPLCLKIHGKDRFHFADGTVFAVKMFSEKDGMLPVKATITEPNKKPREEPLALSKEDEIPLALDNDTEVTLRRYHSNQELIVDFNTHIKILRKGKYIDPETASNSAMGRLRLTLQEFYFSSNQEDFNEDRAADRIEVRMRRVDDLYPETPEVQNKLDEIFNLVQAGNYLAAITVCQKLDKDLKERIPQNIQRNDAGAPAPDIGAA